MARGSGTRAGWAPRARPTRPGRHQILVLTRARVTSPHRGPAACGQPDGSWRLCEETVTHDHAEDQELVPLSVNEIRRLHALANQPHHPWDPPSALVTLATASPVPCPPLPSPATTSPRSLTGRMAANRPGAHDPVFSGHLGSLGQRGGQPERREMLGADERGDLGDSLAAHGQHGDRPAEVRAVVVVPEVEADGGLAVRTGR